MHTNQTTYTVDGVTYTVKCIYSQTYEKTALLANYFKDCPPVSTDAPKADR